MHADHVLIAKRFEEEVSNHVKGNVERQLMKKRSNVKHNMLYIFF
jgi:hypothetical protein